MTIPAVALRGMTILPGMVAHFDISRDKSLRAVEEAMKGDQKLFIVTQKDTEKEDPQGEDLYEVGLLAVVRQVVKLQKNIMRVLIEGIGRAEIYEYTQTADYMQARVIVYDQEDDEQLPEQAKSAMLLSVQETFAKYARVHGKIGQDVMRQVQEETDLLKLLDYVGNSLVISYKKKQKLLEAVTLTARYESVLSSLLQETEILALKRDFQKKVQEHVDKNQKDYLLREQMQVIREELGESNTETDAQEYEKKLQELQASGEVKARIHKEIERFQGISGNSSESTVSRGYIETLLELPWDAVSEDNKDLKHAQKILDEDHYGLEKVKERILEFLAVRNLTGKGESPIIQGFESICLRIPYADILSCGSFKITVMHNDQGSVRQLLHINLCNRRSIPDGLFQGRHRVLRSYFCPRPMRYHDHRSVFTCGLYLRQYTICQKIEAEKHNNRCFSDNFHHIALP